MYKIKILESKKKISSGEIAPVNQYNWGGDYRPETFGQLCFIKDFGFILKMTCTETNPVATVLPPTGQVCIDSCLESFINFKPNDPTSPYINFEVNALGTICCEFSPKGGLRPRFENNNIPLPTVEIFKSDTQWGFIMEIKLEILKAIYGDISFHKDSRLTGNFFKCGDKTPIRHYGSYTKIDFPHPSFHQPQFFADMIIGD